MLVDADSIRGRDWVSGLQFLGHDYRIEFVGMCKMDASLPPDSDSWWCCIQWLSYCLIMIPLQARCCSVTAWRLFRQCSRLRVRNQVGGTRQEGGQECDSVPIGVGDHTGMAIDEWVVVIWHGRCWWWLYAVLWGTFYRVIRCLGPSVNDIITLNSFEETY